MSRRNLLAGGIPEVVGEVELPEHDPDGRHDDIAHERRRDLSERSADHDTDREIDDVPFDRELAEFFEDLHGVVQVTALSMPELPSTP